jgi:hypothetical protein
MPGQNTDVLEDIAADSKYTLYAKLDVASLSKPEVDKLKREVRRLASEVGYSPLLVEQEGQLIAFTR